MNSVTQLAYFQRLLCEGEEIQPFKQLIQSTLSPSTTTISSTLYSVVGDDMLYNNIIKPHLSSIEVVDRCEVKSKSSASCVIVRGEDLKGIKDRLIMKKEN